MDWISRMMIVAAINSAGDMITEYEARDIVFAYGGDPEWVINPPPWVEWVNKRLRKLRPQYDNIKEVGTNADQTAFE